MRLRVVVSVLAVMVLAAGAVVAVSVLTKDDAPAPVSFDDYDQAKVDELVAQGFSEGEALFIALTKIEGKAIGDDRVRITDAFPTGNQAEIDIRVVPTNIENADALKVESGTSGDDFTFSLEYFVSYDVIPVDARPTVAMGPPSAGQFALVAYSPASASAGGDPNGVQVLIKGLVDQIQGDKVDQFVEFLDKKLKTPKLDKLNGKLKAGLLAKELLAMGAELNALMKELDALEKCAKNPTNPLTKKAYSDNPAEQDRILKGIEGVRAELKGNTAAAVIGTVNSAGSGLIKSAPWLGYVIGPGTAWALENFKQVAQDRMNEIRKGVVPCFKDFKIDAGVGPAHITSVKCGGPVGAWSLHVVADVGGSHSDETVSFTLAEDLTGPASASGFAVGPGGGANTGNAAVATLVLSEDGSSGTLTISPGGSVPVTAGDFCKNGQPPGG